PVHLGMKQTISVPYLERAIAKLDLGTYCICDGCNEDIPFERLEAVPGAIRCIDCENAVT
ncbi:MAG: TraR/DksA C4-type zinc finger protein, partial [Candidatus Uhrbacteria bacterium]|nr:TraR/DksA C4-type zinc finger protein [Candidatus Uhrbacteria bacterium]